MPDPAAQLERLYVAGFELQTFERYPNSVGVIRGDCIALMTVTPEGLSMVGKPGWKLGEVLGVLTTLKGKPVFQAKSQVVEATAERVAALRQFESDLQAALARVA